MRFAGIGFMLNKLYFVIYYRCSAGTSSIFVVPSGSGLWYLVLITEIILNLVIPSLPFRARVVCPGFRRCGEPE